MAHPSLLGEVGRPDIVRGAALAGRGPHDTRCNPPQLVLNMSTRHSVQPRGTTTLLLHYRHTTLIPPSPADERGTAPSLSLSCGKSAFSRAFTFGQSTFGRSAGGHSSLLLPAQPPHHPPGVGSGWTSPLLTETEWQMSLLPPSLAPAPAPSLAPSPAPPPPHPPLLPPSPAPEAAPPVASPVELKPSASAVARLVEVVCCNVM